MCNLNNPISTIDNTISKPHNPKCSSHNTISKPDNAIVTLLNSQFTLLNSIVTLAFRHLAQASVDAARTAEWDFHNAILAMKEVVRGQFGADSNEARAIGLKKKSDRKRPVRTKTTATANGMPIAS